MFKALIQGFLAAFETPKFSPGESVNRFYRGALDRVDGRVLTQSSKGVLVEWPRAGQHWEEPGHLCAQVA